MQLYNVIYIFEVDRVNKYRLKIDWRNLKYYQNGLKNESKF